MKRASLKECQSLPPTRHRSRTPLAPETHIHTAGAGNTLYITGEERRLVSGLVQYPFRFFYDIQYSTRHRDTTNLGTIVSGTRIWEQ